MHATKDTIEVLLHFNASFPIPLKDNAEKNVLQFRSAALIKSIISEILLSTARVNILNTNNKNSPIFSGC